MSVCGVEIEVGQKWRTRDGRVVSVHPNPDSSRYPFRICQVDGLNASLTATRGGTYHAAEYEKCVHDLVELLSPVQTELPDLADPPEKFAASIHVGVDEPQAPKQAASNAKASAEAAAEVAKFAAPVDAAPKSALDVQVGGGHYKTFAIQPVEFIHRNGIPFIEGNAIKYLCRWRDKGGIQDLHKVKHYIDLLIEMEKTK